MRGYPKYIATKQDYLNLLLTPEIHENDCEKVLLYT